MECSCGGAVTEGKSSYRVSEDNFCFILDNIPAYKCTRCGKVLFSDETVEKIQKLVGRIKRDSSEIVTGRPSVNLYNY
ncbi:MAG TPA: YgiT-type zinc finger protein [Spirochaetota bacterium]|jgi:YgiT-type zinc finger domain-containing protein|nr:YgiT-type zinc finger protein [Spirochaetota bacterium]HOA06387.1 YgiT-type zinc finger protein [Spirochaetota bacterium]HOF32617.1 YgiT-type zinc finger protein [Spirochaetota bacterium]HOH36706.1 YgiT-type zinc finger protein [Spirochaetota bacterium]HOR43193.1 YgiT-type zinc finger protein [Spirochaetota bacterium]